MGRQITCDNCGTIFKFEVVKDAISCPVCGQNWEDETASDIIDENKVQMWYTSYREPGTFDITDTGDVYCTCKKCNDNNPFPYEYFEEFKEEYVKLKDNTELECYDCGESITYPYFTKRPKDYISPREKARWITDLENKPTCPICGSQNVEKISLTNKAISAVTWGVLAAGHVSKTYRCKNCKAKF